MQIIYLAPLSHYDVAWAFTKEDYLNINEEILENAVKFMKKYKDYKFSWEQIFPLEVLEHRNPRLWAEIKEMIQKGKLEIVDGQYLMADTMLPAGEVLIREILFGKRYCKEKFGVDVPVAWCADSFGMNAQLPQIYRKSGYKWVAFRRGARERRSEFLWKGLDNSTILAHWMPLGYRAGFYLDKLEESYIELNKRATTFNILMPSGSGSVPPQEEVIEVVRQWNEKHRGGSQIKIVTPSEFFRAVEIEKEKFGVREGELYDEALAEVFPQVCSSRAWILIGVRKCEELLATTEGFSTLAWLLGKDYPQDVLNECWKKMLFIAFHDIITGCGIDEIYDEVKESFSFLEKRLSTLLDECLKFISSQINTHGEAVIIFNPLPQKVRNWCEVDLRLPGWEKEPGLSFEGEEIETQLLNLNKDARGKINSAKLGFFVELPSMGYKVYQLVERSKEPEWGIKVEGNKIENRFFRSLVNPETAIIDVFDKKGKLLFKGNELSIENEIGDLYYHRHMFFELVKNESGDGIHYGVFKPGRFSIEKGALKTKIILEEGYYCLRWPYRLFDKFGTKFYKNRVIDITKEIVIYRDLPRIEFVTRIKSRYPNIRLRVKFDTFKEKMVYFRQTQFGVVPEPTELFTPLEKTTIPAAIPAFLSWFEYGDGTRGIAFMNKGIPAVEIRGSKVYLTLLRSVGVLSADGKAGPMVPTPDALELNKDYTFEYALSPHEYDWRRAQIYRYAQEFQRQPLWIQANFNGKLPGEFSFLKLSPDNIILSALKKAEEGDGIIMRFYETKGEAATAEVEFFNRISRCVITDLLEKEECELKLEENKLRVNVKPFEIITLKLEK